MAALTIRRQSSLRVTSPAHAEAMPPSDRITSTVSWARAAATSTQSTRAPSRANRMAAALPLPIPGPREPAPVMMAVLPASLSLMAAPHPTLSPQGRGFGDSLVPEGRGFGDSLVPEGRGFGDSLAPSGGEGWGEGVGTPTAQT